MTPKPNPEQQAIIAHPAQALCITASAGTGKTYTLIERIIQRLKQNVPIENILAISFTDAAAQELKTKLAKEMQKANLDYWKTETAYISTFHSFCSRILQEHWLSAGLPPKFETLTDIPAELLLEKSINKVIDLLLNSGDTGITTLLTHYPRKKLSENIIQLLPAIQAANEDIEKWQYTAKEILNSSYIYNNQKLQELYTKIRDLIEPIKNLSTDKNVEQARQIIYQTCQAEFNRANLQQIAEAFPKQLRTRKDDDEHNLIIQQLAQIRKLCQENAGFFQYSEQTEENFAELTERSIVFLKKVLQEYTEAKTKKQQLDYEDLQIQALNLLRNNPQIAQHYQNLFRAAFVDEFQDTNDLQNQLLKIAVKPDNLFIVGDWKQSIYLFRYAKPKLFQDYINQRAQTGQQLLLNENYRCDRSIIELTNNLCARLFSVDQPLKYEPLQAHKTTAGQAEIVFCEMIRNADLQETSAEARAKEARYIAHKIKSLGNFNKENTCTILMPAFTKIGIYTAALEKANIKYTILGGRDYYSRPEIVNILNFLSILSNPYADFQLAAVLRSELVNLSDDALFQITSGNKGSLFELIQHTVRPLQLIDSERLANFLTIYRELSQYVGKLPISRLLRLTVERTFAIRLALTAAHYAEKTTANLNKLLEIAKDFDRQSLHDFISYVEKLRLKEAREAEADLADENSVKIMTIHNAKGLEFNTVFLANIYRHGSGQDKKQMDFDQELLAAGIPLGLSYSLDEADKEPVHSLARLYAKKTRQALENQESKRLFYVALTRAKNNLYIACTYKTETASTKLNEECLKKRNWGQWLYYLYQENSDLFVPAKVIFNPEIPAEPRQVDQNFLRLADLQEPAKHQDTDIFYSFNNLPATLLSELFVEPKAFIMDYFHGFPKPAPQTGSQFNAKIMQTIGTAVHKAIELKEKTYIDPNLNTAQNKYLQKCLDNFYQSEVSGLIQKHTHHLELDLEYLENNVRYYGRADLIIQTEEEILVYDFKTGQRTPEEDKYCAQVSVYANILQKHFSKKPIPIKGFIFYLHSNELVEVKLNFKIFAECLEKLTLPALELL